MKKILEYSLFEKFDISHQWHFSFFNFDFSLFPRSKLDFLSRARTKKKRTNVGNIWVEAAGWFPAADWLDPPPPVKGPKAFKKNPD